MPVDAHASLTVLAAQLQAVQTMIGSIEKRIDAQHRANEASQRLETIPGIGVIGATAIAAIVTGSEGFSIGTRFCGLDRAGAAAEIRPAASRSSGRSPSRATDTCGAFSLSERIAVLRRARQQPEKYPWLTQLLARRPFKVVAVALANKMARIAWALLAKGGTYRAPAACGSV